MSGGHFGYLDRRISDIADEIEEVLRLDSDNGSSAVQAKFAEAVTALRRAQVMARRIDWLVSGDDSEETFHCRWAEDLAALEIKS